MMNRKRNMNDITCPSHIKTNGKPCLHYIGPDTDNEAGFCKLPDVFRCTEALKKYSPTITQSAFKAFAQCPMKYYYPYMMGIKLKDKHMNDAIKGGTIWGKWVETRENIPNDIQPVLAAKLFALMRAYEDLDITEASGGSSQQQVSINLGLCNVTGYIDKAYDDYIEEVKLSGRPDWYHEKSNIEFQVGTYLMANPKWEYVDIKVTRMPGLKLGKNEELDKYHDRIYTDIVKRPAHYFLVDKNSNVSIIKDKKYGKRFWRKEFDFDHLNSCYLHMVRNMRFMIDNNTWTNNPMACYTPTACFYLPIKKSGGCTLNPSVSQLMFEVADVNDAKEGML